MRHIDFNWPLIKAGLPPEDVKLVESVSRNIEDAVDEVVASFQRELDDRVRSFEAGDYTADFRTAVKAASEQYQEAVKPLEDKLKAAREAADAAAKAAGDVDSLAIKDAAQKLEGAATALEQELKDTRERVKTFTTVAGKTAANAMIKFLTGGAL